MTEATVLWVDTDPETGERVDMHASIGLDDPQDALAWAWSTVERETSEHSTDVRVLIDGKDVTP